MSGNGIGINYYYVINVTESSKACITECTGLYNSCIMYGHILVVHRRNGEGERTIRVVKGRKDKKEDENREGGEKSA